jgi:hypothetical protein
MASAPSPINTSSSNGAPVEASDEALEASVATVGELSGEALETNAAGVGVAADEDDAGDPAPEVGPTVDAAVVGCGHEESAFPLSAP